jgi:hypothetical protein
MHVWYNKIFHFNNHACFKTTHITCSTNVFSVVRGGDNSGLSKISSLANFLGFDRDNALTTVFFVLMASRKLLNYSRV